MSNIRNVFVAPQDTAAIDAFGRSRVSQVNQQIGLKQIYDDHPSLMDTVLNGTASEVHSTVNASATLSTLADGDYAITQTKRKFYYSEGKSQEIYMTFHDFQPQTNIVKRIGYFRSSAVAPYDTDLDGFFIEASNGTHSLKVYKSGTLTAFADRVDWLDPLDGSGSSGLDFGTIENNVILNIDFEWLGLGRIRFFVVYRGGKYKFHEFDFTNGGSAGVVGEPSFKGVYMTSGNQPLRWEIRQNGVGSGSMNSICSTIGSEGALITSSISHNTNSGTTDLSATTAGTKYLLLAVRLRSDRTDTTVNLTNLTLNATTNDDFIIEVLFNPTIAGTVSFTNDEGSLQSFYGDTANTVSGGLKTFGAIFEGGNSYSSNATSAIKLGQNINGDLDVMAICITPLSNGLNIYGSLNWDELI